MKWNLLTTIILPFLLVNCIEKTAHIDTALRAMPTVNTMPATVAAIPLPDGFKRTTYPERSFGSWLRKISIKKIPGYTCTMASLKKIRMLNMPC
jgi:hypothetical protein